MKNLGQEYKTKKGSIVSAKVIRPPCNCKYKCYEKLNETTREIIFSKFWNLGNRSKQWSFVTKLTKKMKKNRCLNRDSPNKRQFTIKYSLPILEGVVVDVCKTMFINTLSVSGRIHRTAWEKSECSSDAEDDKRGKHESHKRVIVEGMIKSVCDHVNSLAPVESHYLRKKTTKLYLDGSLNITKLFNLYNDWFDSEKYSNQCKTLR